MRLPRFELRTSPRPLSSFAHRTTPLLDGKAAKHTRAAFKKREIVLKRQRQTTTTKPQRLPLQRKHVRNCSFASPLAGCAHSVADLSKGCKFLRCTGSTFGSNEYNFPLHGKGQRPSQGIRAADRPHEEGEPKDGQDERNDPVPSRKVITAAHQQLRTRCSS
eukprot:6190393-Pleurochrysis_carterae.AAC.3